MMKMMLFLLAVLTVLPVRAADFVLVQNNQPKAAIVCGEDQSAPVKTAVENFNDALNTITGTRLPIIPDGAEGNRITLIVRKPDSLLTADNFTIRFPDERTMEIEGTEVSIQWAFNHIIREFAGAEWILPEECGLSYTPLKDLTVPAQTIEVKDISWSISRTHSIPTVWWTQNLQRGIPIDHDLTLHAFPLSKYEKDNSWPEAMMPVHNGKKITALPDPKRPRNFWQPCYSNPETAKIAVENLLEYLEKNPGTLGLSLGTNDNCGFCECPECMKLDKNSRSVRSESYFTFINRVLEKVCEKHPNLLVTVFAYTNTYEPPSFELHPNAIVYLTTDFNSCANPRMLAYHKRIIDNWSQKASILGVWDYSWGYPYPAPRLYAPYHLDMLKYFFDHNAKAYYGECWTCDAYEGPKQYLVTKLLWDSNQDLKKLEEEWYVRCVGKKAAPYLKAYYKIWNDYFTGPALSTPWGKSSTGVYMTFYDASCINALREEDIQAADEAMKQVVSLAETTQEQARAVVLMRLWRHTYLRLRLLGAGSYDAKGFIHTPDAALKLLDILSKSAEYIREYEAIGEIFSKDKYLTRYYLSKYYMKHGGSPVGRNFAPSLTSHILTAAQFAGDPKVRKAMEKIAADPAQLKAVRELCSVLTTQELRKNLLPEGNAESGSADFLYIHSLRKGAGTISVTEQFATEGKKAFQMDISSHLVIVGMDLKVEPKKKYLLSFKAFIPQPSAEGYMMAYGLPKDYAWHVTDGRTWLKLSGGVWQNFAVIIDSGNQEKIWFRFCFEKFDTGDKVYLDDLKLMEIEDET